jgi:phosphatidylglycerophosphatase A
MMRWKEFLFTAGYSGYFPVAPGTAGTMVGVLLYAGLYVAFGRWSAVATEVFVALALYPALKLCVAGERFFGRKDPSQVVVDEVLGFLVAVLGFPFKWEIVALAFVLFRFFDILKPWPIGRSQRIKGGMGILIDDLLAGVYTNVVIRMLLLGARHGAFAWMLS